MMTLCAREGCTNPVTQPTGSGRRREFCGSACRVDVAQGRSQRREVREITDRWNAIPVKRTPEPDAPESWWVGLSREAFRTKAAARSQELKPRYGSQPMSLTASIDAMFNPLPFPAKRAERVA